MNRQFLLNYFPELTTDQLDKFMALPALYAEWNAKINVISRKDMEMFPVHHLLHSLGIAKVMKFKGGSKVLDIGTGGGFPGIPLAIMFPDVEFTLCDSIGKKISVVNGVKDALKLKNVKTINGRAEQVNDKFDFIVSRAVAALKDFMPWTRNKFEKKQINPFPNGILYLKGGDLAQEIKEAGVNPAEYKLSDFFEEEFFETKKVLYIKMV